MKRTNRINRGFTLIELLVVIAIIGILIALLAPAIGSTREKSQMAACMNNLKQISMAAFMYADDHNSEIPDVPYTASYVQDSDNIYKCPRDTRPGVGITKPSYTAWLGTPASLLPAHLQEVDVKAKGLLSEMVLYLETNQAGVKDRSEIVVKDVVFRHVGATPLIWDDAKDDQHTVVVFGDGHVMSCRKSQLAELVTAIDPRK